MIQYELISYAKSENSGSSIKLRRIKRTEKKILEIYLSISSLSTIMNQLSQELNLLKRTIWPFKYKTCNYYDLKQFFNYYIHVNSAKKN